MIDGDKFWKAIQKEIGELEFRKDLADTEVEKAYFKGAIVSLMSIWHVFNEAGCLTNSNQ